MEPISILLQYPVIFDNREVAELVIGRRPKARDLVYAQSAGGKDTGSQEIHLIARLAGVNPGLVEELDAMDYLAVQQVVGGFLTPSAAPAAPAAAPMAPAVEPMAPVIGDAQ